MRIVTDITRKDYIVVRGGDGYEHKVWGNGEHAKLPYGHIEDKPKVINLKT